MKRTDGGGGSDKRDQKKPSKLNKLGRSQARYADEPNEDGWIHEGEEYKGEPARQCAAENFYDKYCLECNTKYHFSKFVCPECGTSAFYYHRCHFIAEPGKETCKNHGGCTKLTKENSDKCKAALITNGFGLADILFCTKTCILFDFCPYKQKLVNLDRYGSSLPRCLPEQAMYDSIQEQFKAEYELDNVADQVMLDSLAMALVRRARGQKVLSMNGELVERVRTSPDGSYETWMEPNAISGVVDSLDKRAQAWLKELAVSKAAREGKKFNVSGNINLLSVLSNTKLDITEDQIIDIELEE